MKVGEESLFFTKSKELPYETCRALKNDLNAVILVNACSVTFFYYMTKASGRYNAPSGWLRVRSAQGITQP